MRFYTFLLILFLLLITKKITTEKPQELIKRVTYCEPSNIIEKPQNQTGRLLEKIETSEIDMKRYRYETGFPLTGNDYKIIEVNQ